MSTPFVPNITRLKKHRRRVSKGSVSPDRINLIKYDYAVQAVTEGKLFNNHIEMARKTITNFYSRQTKLFIRMYPNHSYTTKPFDVRRGRGKGSIDSWYQYIKVGKVLIEFQSPTKELALRVVEIVRSKLPIKVKLLTKDLLTESIKISNALKLEKLELEKLEKNNSNEV